MIEIFKGGTQLTITSRPEFNFVVFNVNDLSSVAPYTTSLRVLDTAEFRSAFGITDPLLSNQGTYDVTAIFLGYELNAKLTLKSYDFKKREYSCDLLIEFFSIPDEGLHVVAGAWSWLGFAISHDQVYVKTVANNGADNDPSTGFVYCSKALMYEALAQDYSLNETGYYGSENGMKYKPYLALKKVLESLLPGTTFPSAVDNLIINTHYKHICKVYNDIMNHNSFTIEATLNNTSPASFNWSTAQFDAGDGADYIANSSANYIPLRRGLYYTISGFPGYTRAGTTDQELDALTIRPSNVTVLTIDAKKINAPEGVSPYMLFVSPFYYENPTQQFTFTGFTKFGFRYNQSGATVTGTAPIRVKAHFTPKHLNNAYTETFGTRPWSEINAEVLLPHVNARDFVKEVFLYLGYVLRYDISTKTYKVISVTPTTSTQLPEILDVLSVEYDEGDTIKVVDKSGEEIASVEGSTGKVKEIKFKALSKKIRHTPGRQGLTQELSISRSPSGQRSVALKYGEAEILGNQYDAYDFSNYSDEFDLRLLLNKKIEAFNVDHTAANSNTTNINSGYFYQVAEVSPASSEIAALYTSRQRVKCLCRVTREFIQDTLANFRKYEIPELGGTYIVERVDGLREDLLCEITFKRYG